LAPDSADRLTRSALRLVLLYFGGAVG